MKKQEEASMRKAKKFFAQQKIADGRLQATRQMMHEESHEDKSYEEENSRDYRQNRFGKTPSGRNSKLMNEEDVNDTYQDFVSDEDDNDQMESRAEYDSEEEDDDLDKQYKHRGINQPVSSKANSVI